MCNQDPSTPGRRHALRLILNHGALAAIGCGSGTGTDPAASTGTGVPLPGGDPGSLDSGAVDTHAGDSGVTRPADASAAAPAESVTASCAVDAPAGPATSKQGTTLHASWPRDAVEVICEQAASPGETIHFRVSDNAAEGGATRQVTFVIERLAPSPQVLRKGEVAATRQAVTTDDEPWSVSPDWDVSLSQCVPAEWQTGIYRATFKSTDGKSGKVVFVVRRASSAPPSSTIMKVPFETMQAYNTWGGKSLYDADSRGGRAHRISTRRPLVPGAPQDVEQYIVPFVLFAEKIGVAFDFICGEDMQLSPSVLDAYRCMVIVGHDEYWTEEMRQALERFVARGANLAVFGANTIYWRTRVEPDAFGNPAGVIVCEKRPGSGTDIWYRYRSEAIILGGTYMNGGWLPREHLALSANAGFTVYRPGHWAFEGSGLAHGEQFGAGHRLLRVEVDGVDYVLDGAGNPVSTRLHGAPENIEVLAMYVLPRGWGVTRSNANAAFTVYTTPAGGTVVNAGTISWANGLLPFLKNGTWTHECQVTKNVLLRLR